MCGRKESHTNISQVFPKNVASLISLSDAGKFSRGSKVVVIAIQPFDRGKVLAINMWGHLYILC